MYESPWIRHSNSSARVPAKTACVCESTNPGRTTLPVASNCWFSFVRQLIGRSDPGDLTVVNGNGAVLNDAQVTHFRTATRARVAGNGDQLSCVNDVQSLMPFCRANVLASS